MKKVKRPTKLRAKKSGGVIALLTDFGETDHYVGTVKGVILTMNPEARIVDISHQVHPQNVREAGYLLWASHRYFPNGTVFTCIVDPGVGSERKIICLETERYQFVAPDNGLLDLIALEENVNRAIEIVEPHRFGLESISSTFHGRDIFAPLSALLSLGKPPGQFGKRRELAKPSPIFYEPEKGFADTRILHIDHFGNIVTNIPSRYFEQCLLRIGSILVSEHIRNYAAAPHGSPCMIIGSSGLVEVVVRNGSASATLRAEVGTPISVVKA